MRQRGRGSREREGVREGDMETERQGWREGGREGEGENQFVGYIVILY